MKMNLTIANKRALQYYLYTSSSKTQKLVDEKLVVLGDILASMGILVMAKCDTNCIDTKVHRLMVSGGPIAEELCIHWHTNRRKDLRPAKPRDIERVEQEILGITTMDDLHPVFIKRHGEWKVSTLGENVCQIA